MREFGEQIKYYYKSDGAHGTGDIKNKLTNESSGFIPGQWYYYDVNSSHFSDFVSHVTKDNKYVIAIGSASDCSNCTNFMNGAMANKSLIDWWASCGCYLLYFYDGTRQWTSKNA